jgi:hypothetical protein
MKQGPGFYPSLTVVLLLQALKQIKTSEFMPYVVFIAAPPVEIMRNMHENARIQGKIEHVKTVGHTPSLFAFFSPVVLRVK